MYQLSNVTQVFHQRCKEPALIAGTISGNLNWQDMPIICHLSPRCLACFAALSCNRFWMSSLSSCTFKSFSQVVFLRNRNVRVGQTANNVLKSSFQKKACVENTRDASNSSRSCCSSAACIAQDKSFKFVRTKSSCSLPWESYMSIPDLDQLHFLH